MAGLTPNPAGVPFSGTQAAETDNTTDANNGDRVPGVVVVSPGSGQPTELAVAVCYPRQTVLHRSSLTAIDTVDPNAAPTWVGRVVTAASSGATSLVVRPYGDYGSPDATHSLNFQVSVAGASFDSVVPTGVSGGSGADYTLTVPALAHNHVVGDLVVCVTTGTAPTGTSPTNTTGSNTLVSGGVGGRGCAQATFRCQLTYGSAAATATVMVRVWDEILSAWVNMDSAQMAVSATGTDSCTFVVPGGGYLYYVALTQLTGTGASVKVTAGSS